MKRLTITLDVEEGTTWEQVRNLIAYSTPANGYTEVRAGTTYYLNNTGIHGSAATVERKDN